MGKKIHVKERHFVVDMAFVVGGALIGTALSEIVAGHPGAIRLGAGLLIGVIVVAFGLWFDKRNVEVEEHEIAEAEYKADHPWENES